LTHSGHQHLKFAMAHHQPTFPSDREKVQSPLDRADLSALRALTRPATLLLPGFARFFGCVFARFCRLAM